jgi:hypothetical protein
MSRSRPPAALAALTALTALAVTAAAATAAMTSHAVYWQTPNQAVGCGVEIHASNTPAKWIVCDAEGLPRPKHSDPNGGDPFVQIAAHGRPQLGLMSQRIVEGGNNPVTLAAGTTWSKLGVTCRIKTSKVTCTNKSGHGFGIGKNLYKTF